MNARDLKKAMAGHLPVVVRRSDGSLLTGRIRYTDTGPFPGELVYFVFSLDGSDRYPAMVDEIVRMAP